MFKKIFFALVVAFFPLGAFAGIQLTDQTTLTATVPSDFSVAVNDSTLAFGYVFPPPSGSNTYTKNTFLTVLSNADPAGFSNGWTISMEMDISGVTSSNVALQAYTTDGANDHTGANVNGTYANIDTTGSPTLEYTSDTLDINNVANETNGHTIVNVNYRLTVNSNATAGSNTWVVTYDLGQPS